MKELKMGIFVYLCAAVILFSFISVSVGSTSETGNSVISEDFERSKDHYAERSWGGSIFDEEPEPPTDPNVNHFSSVGEEGQYSFDVWSTSFTGPYGDDTPVDVYYPQDDTTDIYPTLVLGHGFTMDRTYFESWGEYYASWGYVIAVPSMQYAGMFSSDHEKCAYELLATIDFLKDKNGSDSPINGMIDEDKIGMTGFSLGAKASILAAQYEVEDDDQDEDIKALAPMAVSIDNDPDPIPGLDLIDIPVQLQAGENDEIAPPEDNSQVVYDNLEDSPTQYFMIAGANHNQYADMDPASGGIGDGEAEISREEQHRIARKYATSFFEYYLKGEENFGEYLYGEFIEFDLSKDTLLFNDFKYVDYSSPDEVIGFEHNILSWKPSSDDPDDVTHYDIYRSDQEDDGYEYISSVDADGSERYVYIDENKGNEDDMIWWYLIHSVDSQDQECEGTEPVPEPGVSLDSFMLDLEVNDGSSGWNFVSFNLLPDNDDLESILEDEENGVSGSYDKVLFYDSETDTWKSFVPQRDDQFNRLETWDHTMGVWVRMIEDDTLTIEGTEPASTEIELDSGWNMVGLPSSTVGNHGLPEEVTIVGYFESIKDSNLAYDHEPENFEFEPGQGYLLYNGGDEKVIWEVE